LGLERKRRENQQAEWLRPWSSGNFVCLFGIRLFYSNMGVSWSYYWHFLGIISDTSLSVTCFHCSFM